MAESRSVNQVPDVVGFDAADACEMVRASGLVPYGPQFEPAPDTGTVVAQEPASGVRAEDAAPVMLWTDDRHGAGVLAAGPGGSAGAELS